MASAKGGRKTKEDTGVWKLLSPTCVHATFPLYHLHSYWQYSDSVAETVEATEQI